MTFSLREALYPLADALQLELSFDQQHNISSDAKASISIPGVPFTLRPLVVDSLVNPVDRSVGLMLKVAGDLFLYVSYECAEKTLILALIDRLKLGKMPGSKKGYLLDDSQIPEEVLEDLRDGIVRAYTRGRFGHKWVEMKLGA
jgi:hypothetical protein